MRSGDWAAEQALRERTGSLMPPRLRWTVVALVGVLLATATYLIAVRGEVIFLSLSKLGALCF